MSWLATLSSMKRHISFSVWQVLQAACGLLVAALVGCATPHQIPASGADLGAVAFKLNDKASTATLMSKEDLALLEESANPVYVIGSGNVVRDEVFGRPEVSGKHVVPPDGNFNTGERDRNEARRLLGERLGQYFTEPFITLHIEEYTPNQVTVLGRVERASMQKSPHLPTRAERGRSTEPDRHVPGRQQSNRDHHLLQIDRSCAHHQLCTRGR